ncbi:MAG: 50S ribosomal protein L13 [Candidatus Woesearchaeota archaeon]
MIIDGKDLVLGRLASFAARKALLGEKVDIVNCEEVLISGSKKTVLARFHKLMDLGCQKAFKGPFVTRLPDRIVRKAVKRMLPIRRGRGRDAYHNVMCYIGVPDELKGQETCTFKNAELTSLSTLKYMKLKDVSKQIGGKVY